MKKLFGKINLNRNYFFLVLFILAVAVIILPEVANAANEVNPFGIGWDLVKAITGSPILIAVGTIAALVVVLFGALNGLIIAALVEITQYNNFINEPSIRDAWVVVRDLCNMFFILILLVVAFATILRIETYQWKKILPKLLIMAVLINFSRTICGLIIDFSQVIMLTFVNAWGGAGNFVDSMKMVNYFMGTATKDFGTGNWSVLQVVAGMLLGIMFLIISGIVLLVAMSVFLMRIVMLWILMVLSPFAFLAAAFPAGQKYATQWWSEFVRYILNGPALAFFIWMALITSRQITRLGNVAVNQTGTNQCASINLGITQITCLNDFLPFILSIGMLVGGLMMTQQIGGVGSSIAGKGLDWAKKAPLMLGAGGLMAGGWLGRKIKSGAASELFATKQVDAEGNVSGWKGRGILGGLGSGIARTLYGLETRPTKIIQGIKEGLKSQAEKEEMQATGASAISLKRGGIGGLIKGLGVSRDLTESLVGPGGLLWHKGFRRVYESTIKGGPKGLENVEKEIEKKKANRGVSQEEYDAKESEYNENNKNISEEIKVASKAGNMVEVNRLSGILGEQLSELRAMKPRIIQEKNREKREGIMQKEAEEISKLEKKLSLRKPIQTFYANRAREALISEASKTLGDNDNEEALQEILRDAIANGNKEVAQAVILHAAKVSHLNEMMHGYRSKRDVYEDEERDKNGNIIKRGRLLAKKGDYLPQSGGGLHSLIQQALIEDLGMDEQTAYAVESEASTIAKSVKHQNYTETVGSKNGLLYQRKINGPGGQLARARGEARKVDAESFVRNYNRIGWGDEFQQADGSRVFKLNALGLDNFVELADTIAREIKGRRMNKNAVMNIANDGEALMAWAEGLEKSGLKYYDENSENDDKMESYVDLAKRLIAYGKNVAQTQKAKDDKTPGGRIKDLQAEILKRQTRPT